MVDPGDWLVLATLGVVLVLFGLGVYWAYRNGQFEDIESAKFAMMESERKYHDDQF